MDLASMTDRVVAISGIAQNAVPWAVITDDELSFLVYVEGLRDWDADVYGKTVEVSGLLVHEPVAPEATSVAGRRTHGAVGKAFIMRDAKWRIAE